MAEASKAAAPESLAGLLAEFPSVETLKAAAARVRDEGFTRWDVHSPFPLHGIERAMGVRPTPLPWLVLAAGVAGGLTALGMQWWMNAISYPQIISGKPFFSLPANIPVAFELIVLFSALAAFGGALALNQLPQFSHFLFRAKRFHRVTTDGFFLSVAAADPKFDEASTPELLQSFGATDVEICRQPTTGRDLPKALAWILIVATTLALLPPLAVALARQAKSPNPRLHPVADMDFQPKYKPQAQSAFYPDRRTMRLPVAGTVAVGDLNADPHFHLGYRPEQETQDGEADEPEAGAKDQRDYYTTLPDRLQEKIPMLVARGRERFDIYCAVCHGQVGNGSGMTSLRALERQDPDWAPPTSLHKSTIREQPVGKLFNTITNGLGKMPGYAAQIPVEDRWAIVLYVRALQRSQNAAVEDVPKEIRPQLR